jgi:hypothetical protein
MNKAAITTILSSVLTLGIGCKHHNEPMPTNPPPPTAAASVAEINSAKFLTAQVPQAVQSAFNRDVPKGAVDTVTMHTDSAGRAFYQITYMLNGAGGSASYFANGQKLP